jgi:ATP-dependent Lon protease
VPPVGGIKEKSLQQKELILRNWSFAENKSDIDEIKESYLQGLYFHYVKEMHEVDIAITNLKL